MFRSFPRTRESRATNAGVRGPWIPRFPPSLKLRRTEMPTRRSLVRRRVAGMSGIDVDSIRTGTCSRQPAVRAESGLPGEHDCFVAMLDANLVEDPRDMIADGFL